MPQVRTLLLAPFREGGENTKRWWKNQLITIHLSLRLAGENPVLHTFYQFKNPVTKKSLIVFYMEGACAVLI